MFIDIPNATPIWLFVIIGAVVTFVPPRVKRMVSKYVTDHDMQNLYAFIGMVVIGLIIVTLSVLVEA